MIKNKKNVSKKTIIKGKGKIQKTKLKIPPYDSIQEKILSVIKTEADKKYFHTDKDSGCYYAVKYFDRCKIVGIHKAADIFKGTELERRRNPVFIRRVEYTLVDRVYKVTHEAVKRLSEVVKPINGKKIDNDYFTVIRFKKS